MTEAKEGYLALVEEELEAWVAMKKATDKANALGLAQAQEVTDFHARRRREMAAIEAEVVAACARYGAARRAIGKYYRAAVKGILVRGAEPYARGERPDSEDRPD